MYKQNNQLQGWDIDKSMDSVESEKKYKNISIRQSPQPSPIRVKPSNQQTSPIRVSIQQKFVFINQLINKKQEVNKIYNDIDSSQKVFNVKAKVQQPINITHLRIKLNGIPRKPQHTKAYTQNQIQSILHLKRRNLYLRSVLKKSLS